MLPVTIRIKIRSKLINQDKLLSRIQMYLQQCTLGGKYRFKNMVYNLELQYSVKVTYSSSLQQGEVRGQRKAEQSRMNHSYFFITFLWYYLNEQDQLNGVVYFKIFILCTQNKYQNHVMWIVFGNISHDILSLEVMI